MAAQSLNWSVPKVEQNRQRRFCALGFRARSRDLLKSCKPYVIMVLLADPDGKVRFLVHPELRNMFCGEDLAYIDALVWDLIERVQFQPEDVLKQLCSLGDIGPLVTLVASDERTDEAALSELSGGLVEL
jgi:hypothetical protein